MRHELCVAFAAALALGLDVRAAGPALFTGSIEDWNDGIIDQLEFVQSGPWGGAYDAVFVEPIDMSKTEIGGKDKANEAANEAAKIMNRWAQTSVRDGYTAGAPPIIADGAADAAPEGKVVVLKWRCESIDPGSRAKRFWVGFGAGHGGITVTGALVDRATGAVLVTFRHTRLSGRGIAPSGGIYSHVLEEAGTEVAKDVGRMMAVLMRTGAAR